VGSVVEELLVKGVTMDSGYWVMGMPVVSMGRGGLQYNACMIAGRRKTHVRDREEWQLLYTVTQRQEHPIGIQSVGIQ
jgi:hypothetical protein